MSRIQLGDRAYVPTGESTVEHDVWLTSRLQRAGIDNAAQLEGETPEQFGHRLLAQLLGSDCVFEIVGAILIPADTRGEDWTPELARETAQHVARLTGPEDRARFRTVILSMLIDFFEYGRDSSRASGSSSPGTAPATTMSKPIASAPGVRSFEASRGETTTAPSA